MILNELIDFFGDSEKGFSDDVAMLWIRFWVADILDEAEEQAREECVKICMAKWHDDREIKKFRERNVTLCGVSARGSLIEGVTEGLVKDVVKDKTSLAHRLQISGYGLSRISEEMDCGESLVAELLLKRKEILTNTHGQAHGVV